MKFLASALGARRKLQHNIGDNFGAFRELNLELETYMNISPFIHTDISNIYLTSVGPKHLITEVLILVVAVILNDKYVYADNINNVELKYKA